MKRKIDRILLLIVFCTCFGILVYTGIRILNPFSIGRLLAYLGILLMFGSPLIYYLGGIISSFFGHRVIGKIITTHYGSSGSESRSWYSVYSYIDKKGKYKFGMIKTYKEPNKTILIRYFGNFNWANNETNISQEEYDQYDWSNINIKDAEIKSKKFIRNFWLGSITSFIIAAVLIIIGGIIS